VTLSVCCAVDAGVGEKDDERCEAKQKKRGPAKQVRCTPNRQQGNGVFSRFSWPLFAIGRRNKTKKKKKEKKCAPFSGSNPTQNSNTKHKTQTTDQTRRRRRAQTQAQTKQKGSSQGKEREEKGHQRTANVAHTKTPKDIPLCPSKTKQKKKKAPVMPKERFSRDRGLFQTNQQEYGFSFHLSFMRIIASKKKKKKKDDLRFFSFDS